MNIRDHPAEDQRGSPGMEIAGDQNDAPYAHFLEDRAHSTSFVDGGRRMIQPYGLKQSRLIAALYGVLHSHIAGIALADNVARVGTTAEQDQRGKSASAQVRA